MTNDFTVVIERDADGWYIGSVPELKGCYTQARTIDELNQRIKEAISVCLEDKVTVVRNTFIGVHRVEIES